MEIHIPHNLRELNRLVGKLVVIKLNRDTGPNLIRTFSGVVKDSEAGELYEFLKQASEESNNKKFRANELVLGIQYTKDIFENQTLFLEEGIYPGQNFSGRIYGGVMPYSFAHNKESFEKRKQLMIDNGSWIKSGRNYKDPTEEEIKLLNLHLL